MLCFGIERVVTGQSHVGGGLHVPIWHATLLEASSHVGSPDHHLWGENMVLARRSITLSRAKACAAIPSQNNASSCKILSHLFIVQGTMCPFEIVEPACALPTAHLGRGFTVVGTISGQQTLDCGLWSVVCGRHDQRPTNPGWETV